VKTLFLWLGHGCLKSEAQFHRINPGGALPIDDKTMDIVWASEILEHVFDTQLLTHEFFRILKPSGKLIATVPYHGLLKNLAIALFRFDRHYNPTGGHIHFFTKKSLVDLCSKAEFTCRDFVGLGRGIPWLWKSMFVVFQLADSAGQKVGETKQ